MKRIFKPLAMFLLGTTLSLGFAFSAWLVADALVRIGRSESVRVKGSASRLVDSDYAIWNGSISASAPELASANRLLAASRGKALEFLKKAGVVPAEYSVGQIRIEKIMKRDDKGHATNAIEKYVLSQEIQVSTSDVLKIQSLARTFTDLTATGIMACSGDPCYTIKNPEIYKMELLKAATENGRERAVILAGSSGGKISSLISASQGIFQILSPGSSEISDMGTYDKSTIRKEIRAVVTLEFKTE